MKWYWAKIALTALVIFCVGYGGIVAFRATKRTVVSAVESNDDLTIPLPFVPFNFDGNRLGTFRKVVFHRSSPETVQSVDITVRLADSSKTPSFGNCQLTVDDPSRLNEHSSFRCAKADSTMEGFGSVIVQARDGNGDWNTLMAVPLVLPKDVAQKIRGHEVRAHASQLEADRFRAIGDSLRILGRRMATAGSDSMRSEIQDAMQSLQEEMNDLRESISEASSADHGAVATPAPPEPPLPPAGKAPATSPKPATGKASKAPR